MSIFDTSYCEGGDCVTPEDLEGAEPDKGDEAEFDGPDPGPSDDGSGPDYDDGETPDYDDYDVPPEEDPDFDDRSEPQPPPPEPPPEPMDAPPSAGELASIARFSRRRALNSLDRARAALNRYAAGTSTTSERMTVERAMADYFPGSDPSDIAQALGEARDFLAGAMFVGISSMADVERLPADGTRENAEFGWESGNPAHSYFNRNIIFVYPSYAPYGAADRASILTHEGVHGAREPGTMSHGSSRVDHGGPGGAQDNAWNYQGLTAQLAGLPISSAMQGDIGSNRSR